MNIRESEFGPLPSYIFAVWLQLMELSAPAPGEWPAPAPWQVSSLQPQATLWARRTVELCVIKCAEIQIWLGNHPTRNLRTFMTQSLTNSALQQKWWAFYTTWVWFGNLNLNLERTSFFWLVHTLLPGRYILGSIHIKILLEVRYNSNSNRIYREDFMYNTQQ